MRSVEDFVEQLKTRYGKTIPFKKICEDENITAVKTKLDQGLDGLSFRMNGYKIMLLNEHLPFWERRDVAYHELYHLLKSATGTTSSTHYSKKECTKADLFAALCRIPKVTSDDTIDSICDKWNVSPTFAKIRIEFEVKKQQ